MTPAAWIGAALVAAWVAAGFAIAVGIGRSVRIADDDHDVWGCDTCEQQAVEQSIARHPSSRNRCPDYVPDEWAA